MRRDHERMKKLEDEEEDDVYHVSMSKVVEQGGTTK